MSMLLNELFTLTEALDTSSQAFRNWFNGSKVVDSNGNPLPVYHGTARPDRVGKRFRKSRATSGPMAYFTDDPEIAGNYAKSKNDTSLSDEDHDFEKRFLVKLPDFRKPVPLLWAWPLLPVAKQKEIAEKGMRLSQDEDGNLVFDQDGFHNNGLGAFDLHLRQASGNALRALLDEWVYSGAFGPDEVEDVFHVFKACGVDYPLSYNDPNAKFPFVYQVFLRICNPLDTSAIPGVVVVALKKQARRQRAPAPHTDMWNKNGVDPSAWIRNLDEDLANGTTLVWTSIPDWVTKVLERFGYDGIRDTGGKHGGNSHAVWIPFHERQIKSAISNKNFDITKSGIHT